MTHDPWLIVVVLLAVLVLVLSLSRHSYFCRWFDFIPPVFWIYFLPMSFSAAGIIDAKSPVLGIITTYLLPSSLLLLLVGVNLKAIAGLGKMAIGMFFIGSAGILTGAFFSFLIFKDVVGHEFCLGFGALSASWTGGSANMIAVKEALVVPDRIFSPMVIVDTVVPYVWMGCLVAGVGFQAAFDRFNNVDRRVFKNLEGPSFVMAKVVFSWKGIVRLALFAALGGWLAFLAASRMPVLPGIMSKAGWVIVIVSVLGLMASCTSWRCLEKDGSSRLGTYLLYFVLTAIGAKASVVDVSSALVLIAAGVVIILVHAIFLVVGARLLKAPMFLVAVASQANVGGVASAPVVAEVYAPGFSSVGLLLAILGNIVGTYVGILCAQLCRLYA